MALIKCGECGSEISDKAVACPKCGAPVPQAPAPKPKNDTSQAFGIVALVVVVGIAVVVLGPWSGKDDDKPAAKAKVACAAADLSCRGNEGVVAASVYCKDPIERMAKHSVRWVDGTFDMKMSRFRWTGQAGGPITYVGDKVEFQNGFGAFTRVIYECDLANDQKSVVDVRIREGRLPAS